MPVTLILSDDEAADVRENIDATILDLSTSALDAEDQVHVDRLTEVRKRLDADCATEAPPAPFLPTPWHVESACGGWHEVLAACGGVVFKNCYERAANRIVACVNACEGINDDHMPAEGFAAERNDRTAIVDALSNRAASLGRANVYLTAALAEAREERDSAVQARNAEALCGIAARQQRDAHAEKVKALQALVSECHAMLTRVEEVDVGSGDASLGALLDKLDTI